MGSAGLPIMEEPRTDLEDKLCLREEEIKQEEPEEKCLQGLIEEGEPDSFMEEDSINVKLPVLVARDSMELDVMETLVLDQPALHIVNIEWSLKSYEAQFPLQGTALFFEGMLEARIEWVSPQHTTRLTKVDVPVEKHIPLAWIAPVSIPYNQEATYTFREGEGLHESVHEGSYEVYADPLQCSVDDLYMVWHVHSLDREIAKEVSIKGVVEVGVQVRQPQYVHLFLAE